MNLPRELTFQSRHEIEQLVRLIAAVVGIAVRAVDHLLQDQMPPRVVGKFCPLQEHLEVGEIAMQVAGGEDIVHVR